MNDLDKLLLRNIMKTRIYIIALLSIVSLSVLAQPSTQYREINGDVKNYPVVRSVSGYGGTVYQPFSETVPSEQTAVGEQYSTNNPTGPRKDFGKPTDPGNQSNEYPIGEPWIMVVLAVVFGGVIALRRKRRAAAK